MMTIPCLYAFFVNVFELRWLHEVVGGSECTFVMSDEAPGMRAVQVKVNDRRGSSTSEWASEDCSGGLAEVSVRQRIKVRKGEQETAFENGTNACRVASLRSVVKLPYDRFNCVRGDICGTAGRAPYTGTFRRMMPRISCEADITSSVEDA